jgi:hypothetical protein
LWASTEPRRFGGSGQSLGFTRSYEDDAPVSGQCQTANAIGQRCRCRAVVDEEPTVVEAPRPDG